MPFAGYPDHLVVDKYERGPNVVNEDIVGFAPGRQYQLVLSLSTLEHVGWDEEPRDPEKAAIALRAMEALVQAGGAMLVTIPIGVHRRLEEFFVSEGPFDALALLARTSRRPRWEERDLNELREFRYGLPYSCGNAILIGVKGDPFGRPRT
jgi:hypothetical protein